MALPPVSRRSALFSGAGIAAGTALLRPKAAQAATASQEWDPHYSGTPGAVAKAPAVPGKDYRPSVTPNGSTLPFKLVDGVKVFHLVAGEVKHEFAPGLSATCWGYNGQVHGPTIEAAEGDRVRVYVTNHLPAATTVHWHGVFLPNGMDGVGGLTQAAIKPGETYRYEWTFRQHGTFMYHSHHDEMTQMALGLLGMIVVHPRNPAPGRVVDRDFAILLSEWSVKPGTSRPDPNEMSDFNLLTMNARVYPGTAPLVCKRGERVRIRFGNLSGMDHHPIHLHGFYFKLVATDGGAIPLSAQYPETTVLVPTGTTRDIEFIADEPGDWPLHCHMTHHVMNQMGHGIPNLIGVSPKRIDPQLRRVVPGYMTMGQTGMLMDGMQMDMPTNSLAMRENRGPYDVITMGGMFTLLKVRDKLDSYDDPGWYQAAPETRATQATSTELSRDGINPPPYPPASAQTSEIKPHDEHRVKDSNGTHNSSVVFLCPMHVGIRRAGPGSCPVCGMTLEPVRQAPMKHAPVKQSPATKEPR
jgi:manganese oxidase